MKTPTTTVASLPASGFELIEREGLRAPPAFDLVVRRPERFGLYYFTAPTAAGKAWVRRNDVDAPNAANGFAVEDARYADDILSGALGAGLTVGWVPRGETEPVAMAVRGSPR